MSAARRLLAAAALVLVTSLAAGLDLDRPTGSGAELRSQAAQDSAGWG